MSATSRRDARLRRNWDNQASSYDSTMARTENRHLASSRSWLCEQAVGATLEVAVGTGRNLAHYPDDVRLAGVEWSTSMLEVAGRRAEALGRSADLRHGDAQDLPFPDAHFDTVVCTYALCGIRDDVRALAEMDRVLRPGGLLLLADHVGSSVWPVWAIQLLVDGVSIPLQGEHYRRRPLRHVRALGFEVERHERTSLGIIEMLTARKPTT